MRAGRFLLIVLIVTLGVFSATRRRSKPSPVALPVWTGADAGVGTPLPARSPGCARSGAATGTFTRTVKVAGYDRRYLMVVPTDHGAARPLPVIFHFHGRGTLLHGEAAQWQTPARFLAGGLPALPEVSRGAIFVAPRGTPFPADRSVGWYVGCPSDDADFFDAMLAEIGDSHCIDPRAVFVTGFSWGAEMAVALACCRGEKIRAIAPASGTNLAAIPACPAGKLPALRATFAEKGDWAYSEDELVKSVTFFRKAHHCSDQSDPVEPAPCVSYRGCDQPVVDCRYPGLGHTIAPRFAEATWKFFAELTP